MGLWLVKVRIVGFMMMQTRVCRMVQFLFFIVEKLVEVELIIARNYAIGML